MRARYNSCNIHKEKTAYHRMSQGLVICATCSVMTVLGYWNEAGKALYEENHPPFRDLDKAQLPTEADAKTVALNHRFKGYAIHEALLHSGMVKRYHTHPYVIGVQTVAEHTFRCMALMVSLWPEHTPQALKMMLYHDGAEGVVGDISSTVKKMYPGVGEALDTIEDHILASTGMYVEEDQDEETRRWVRICDWLEGMFYAIDQMAMGNAGMAVCHNAYVHALNQLEMPAEDREIIRQAHHRYIRYNDDRGGWKVPIGSIDLLDKP